jgi:predicted  nucleic acid-binding Zn-ribbon protein
MQERCANQKKSHAVKEREWKRNVTIASGDRIDKDKTKPAPQKSLESEKALERAKERVEIATASVRAAEMREEKARKRLEKVQDELRSVQQDNDRLSVELSDALDRQNTATDRLEIFRSSHGRREEALAKRVARAEQNLRRVEEEMDLLRIERDGVRDALLSERLKFAGERREEQMRYDRIMRDERDGYETEISLLKDQLSRQAARKASVVASANGEDRQLSISMVADANESPTEQSRKKKRKGRLGRAWRRITSPRSWWFVG